MASWIKMRADLETDPKFLQLARIIGRSPEVTQFISKSDTDPSLSELFVEKFIHSLVFTALYRVWAACNQHAFSGIWLEASFKDIDDIAALPGFGKAMEAVGWAVESSEEDGTHTVTFPNFPEYNSPVKDFSSRQPSPTRRSERPSIEDINRVNNRFRQVRRRAGGYKERLISQGLPVSERLERLSALETLSNQATAEEYRLAAAIDTSLRNEIKQASTASETLGEVGMSEAQEEVQVVQRPEEKAAGATVDSPLIMPARDVPKGAFTMYPEWRPTERVYTRLTMGDKPTSVLNLDRLAGFKNHHLDTGKGMRQDQWESLLYRWLMRAVEFEAPAQTNKPSRKVDDISWMEGL